MRRRDFADATDAELRQMIDRCTAAVIGVAKEAGLGGLSQADDWNVYRALQEAIHGEHRRAQRRGRVRPGCADLHALAGGRTDG